MRPKKIVGIIIGVILFPALVWAASITINPDSGKPKTPIVIEGKGFKPGERVDVLLKLSDFEIIGLGTRKVDKIVADQSGAFKVKSAIPKMAKPGIYKVIATGDKGSYAESQIKVVK
jgi:hypothetical protein